MSRLRRLAVRLRLVPKWNDREVEKLVDGYSGYLADQGRWNAEQVSMYRENLRWTLLGIGEDPMMQAARKQYGVD
jgi:hypothetical protein